MGVNDVFLEGEASPSFDLQSASCIRHWQANGVHKLLVVTPERLHCGQRRCMRLLQRTVQFQHVPCHLMALSC
jgi:hypothetical protein